MKPKSTLFPGLLFSSLLLPIFASAAAHNILPNSTLYASTPTQTWTSPNTTFSLGFITVGSAHYAAVTYNGFPVWTAGGTDSGGGAADSSASLQFLSDGNLRLVNGSSGAVVWQSDTAGRGVSSAALDDSGNFTLLNGSVPIWSTFENPTDTILPTQNFTTDNVLASGLYSFHLLPSGNLTLKWNNSILYWNSGLNSSFTTNLTSPSLGIQSIGILSLFDPSLSSPAVLAYSSDYAEGNDVFRFLKLDSDGNLRIYSYAQGSQNSTERWAAVADQCLVFGYCGNFGICSYNETSPICECPSRNFEPIDPKDSRQGCKRKVEIADCPGSGTMLQLDHAKFLTYPPEVASQVFFVGISACGLNCLVSGSCIASTSLSDGTGLCYLKLPDFVSGYQSPALPSTSFVKVCGPALENPPLLAGITKGNSRSLQAWIIVVAVIATISVLVMFGGGLLWWCCRNSPRLGALSAQYALIEYASGAPVQFSFKDLQRATKDKQSGQSFSWECRFKIALGTAKGITYLHEECRDCIVHCDIKPENILLDETYNAKVSDFGLAKLVNPKDHRERTLTSVRGTRGYLAPEWLSNLPITSKSDIYSYGMVLLELVSGRRNFEVSAETNHKKFSIWAYDEFERGNVKGIVDERLGDCEFDMEQVIRAIQVSFWCIQEQPSQRPTMGKVVQMLEGITEIEKPPPPKAAIEGSSSGTSMDISAFSNFAAPAPAPSSSSSFRTREISSFVLGRNAERATSVSFTT
ncbi:hypothetical protein Vadar_004269 [Vaccinium darrowii]|uniref:Uncharacterized protein n=1 Tax=Vaccinium darrowii TaxID=229202 RepID=A0ACB7WXI2_9ERIC|nr:hypothetical protein Vadar_004269 [Vaccinium darrowii]